MSVALWPAVFGTRKSLHQIGPLKNGCRPATIGPLPFRDKSPDAADVGFQPTQVPPVTTARIEIPAGGTPSAGLPNGIGRPIDWAFYLAVLLLGSFLWWAARYHAAAMPAWGPWEFSWPWFIAAALAVWWYARGIYLSAPSERPPLWQSVAYFAGVAVIYAVLQTHFEYLAEHMFFLNRVQHVAMHHLGPFLIALAWPGATLRKGMPRVLPPVTDGIGRSWPFRLLQQPFIASILFVGLVIFWLIPDVHFRAMVDPKLYQVMNWSMVVDGVLFWVLVLDPRPKPPARASFGGRAAMAFSVILPQMILGAIIAFTNYDIYSFYAWCGRIYASIDAIADQQMGGLIIWIPTAMMSAVAFILVINFLRVQEEKSGRRSTSGGIEVSADWTGR
jgi:putative membrane protein